MKISIKRLEEIVREVVKEAAAEGKMQAIYKRRMNKRIATAATGGNKNTPPFTKRPAKSGKSGLGPY